MAGKIFISCGQASTDEKRATTAVAEWLKSEGFEPYVAIQVQSIVDLNAGVIEALKRSDFYLFINFRREMVLSSQDEITRGSLFTQQELAIAYALGFEKMLFLNQQGVAHEGMFSFIVSNTPEFTEYDELLPRVKEAVRLAKWEPSYSRHLIAANLRWSEPIGYIDHTGQRAIVCLHADIQNSWPDVGAVEAISRLAYITPSGGSREPCFDRSKLKVSGDQAYSQTIWPNSHGAFDLLTVSLQNPTQVYLNSALDVQPRQAITNRPGEYTLEYQVFSQGFPTLTFLVKLHVTGNYKTTVAEIVSA